MVVLHTYNFWGWGGEGGNRPPIPSAPVHDAINNIIHHTLSGDGPSRLEPPGLSKKDSKYQMAFFLVPGSSGRPLVWVTLTRFLLQQSSGNQSCRSLVKKGRLLNPAIF